MKFLEKKNLTSIGRINKVSGFKGEVSCLVTLAHPEKLLKHKFLFVLIEGLPVPFLVQSIEFKGDDLIVKFEDVDNEIQAKKLSQKELFAEKIRATKKNEIITWNDLTGYKVIDENHGELGTIEEVLEYPMQMIARCTFKEQEIMFPLNDDIVIEIDDAKNIVHVDLPEGLLDVYLSE
jgi:16S rRNA processing protein RimM